MKIILLATQTADGYIARDREHLSTTWTTSSDKRFFTRVTKQAGIVVMGYNTFATFGKALPGRRLIVLTRKDHETVEGVEYTSDSPAQLLERLENEGAKSVIVAGGLQIYNQYMEAGLITELYLSIQPVLFGRGMPLFDLNMDVKLELLDSQVEVSDGTVVNHYIITTTN
ncbi:MAG: folA [Patescibacteria group bacterium]|nr:folA [Patescibacteria group bacterium]